VDSDRPSGRLASARAYFGLEECTSQGVPVSVMLVAYLRGIFVGGLLSRARIESRWFPSALIPQVPPIPHPSHTHARTLPSTCASGKRRRSKSWSCLSVIFANKLKKLRAAGQAATSQPTTARRAHIFRLRFFMRQLHFHLSMQRH